MLMKVKTAYGWVEGVKSNAGFALFRGVPYAKPPVGELRWKAPEKPDKWEGVRKCDRYGDACRQFDRWGLATDDVTDDSDHPYIMIENYPYPPKMSEDCLYLNIYTPADSENDRLPVMMYIHGGGLQQWYGSDYEYCGDNFCRQGCILVSITYRLNIFGYFTHPELAKENEHGSSGNYGLLDQIQALKWIHENIRAFGGDPDNITVFGQSAGGRSALALAVSPLSRDLVRHVSIQSAGGIGSVMMDGTREKQEKMGVEIMQNLSCHSIAEMRRLDWQILRDENDRLGFFNGFGMYADGYVLPEDIDKMVVKGDIRNADIIIGCTVDEGANDRKPPFGSNTCAQARAFGKVIHELGHRVVYEYVFDRPQPGDDAGTPHSCDNRYQFGTLDGSWRPYTEEDWILSEVMQKYWANFAATGNPNGDGLSPWLPYDENELSMKLAAEGCEMVDYNDFSSGKLKKLEDKIIENIKKQIQ
ncbi:MAG: carboxylesterase family protein [Erysipelotrichaceae bacterium]|nr:carboxylesterase family protein [Erysipelotrichaceae bacterium]